MLPTWAARLSATRARGRRGSVDRAGSPSALHGRQAGRSYVRAHEQRTAVTKAYCIVTTNTDRTFDTNVKSLSTL